MSSAQGMRQPSRLCPEYRRTSGSSSESLSSSLVSGSDKEDNSESSSVQSSGIAGVLDDAAGVSSLVAGAASVLFVVVSSGMGVESTIDSSSD